ncbi:hypothetical protein GCM10010387_22590 [Streptomyces inusitatus]|uniref:Uncharacterized protein n=1 Tax=Streptomyces inusitatus TaxID=68221 RepID=A0A918Q1L0_9ACTN|nr:hypothetical protein [Streptomyces inusitatus]GGZ28608.1 hypothetical protein GCM10010387_22590 [Streptomyces inusitatus]
MSTADHPRAAAARLRELAIAASTDTDGEINPYALDVARALLGEEGAR